MHPLESCHEKILRRCLSEGSWRDLLPPAPALAAAASPAPARISARAAVAPRNASSAAPPAPAQAPPAAPAAPLEWILIPGGSYMMGAPDLGAEPVRRVAIRTFEMAKTPVTVAQYRACLSAG